MVSQFHRHSDPQGLLVRVGGAADTALNAPISEADNSMKTITFVPYSPEMKAKSAGVQKIGFKWLRESVIGLCCLVAYVASWAQTAPIKFYPSPLTGGLKAVVDLQGIWLDENGNRHVVPFNHFDRDEMDLVRVFDLPDFEKLQDTLYLYCEAVAWSSEIFLNGHLLAVTDDPFAEHLLPLKKEWLTPTSDTLKIHLSTAGMSFPWYPKRFLGIFRQMAILQVDALPRFPKFPDVVQRAPKAAVLAAWSPKLKYVHDSTIIREVGAGLFSFPYRVPIAFPFRPSNQSLAILAALGWQVMASPAGADSLAAYNAFPFSTEAAHKNLHFWRDEQMRPTQAYGKYQSQDSINNPELIQPNTASLFIFLLIPVLCMVLLKLVAPKAYGSLSEYLTKTKIYLELIADNKFLKVEQRWLMNGLRMVITSVTMSMLLYYIQLSESWQMLNILRNHSILYRALYGESTPLWEIFLWTFLVVVSLNLAKYVIINGIGTVFRVFSLGPSIQNLDVFAAFPLNLVPYVPATFIFFMEPSTGMIVLRCWAVLGVLYGARRAWLMYSGLGKLYQISGSLKILYICTLEILPWVILI